MFFFDSFGSAEGCQGAVTNTMSSDKSGNSLMECTSWITALIESASRYVWQLVQMEREARGLDDDSQVSQAAKLDHACALRDHEMAVKVITLMIRNCSDHGELTDFDVSVPCSRGSTPRVSNSTTPHVSVAHTEEHSTPNISAGQSEGSLDDVSSVPPPKMRNQAMAVRIIHFILHGNKSDGGGIVGTPMTADAASNPLGSVMTVREEEGHDWKVNTAEFELTTHDTIPVASDMDRHLVYLERKRDEVTSRAQALAARIESIAACQPVLESFEILLHSRVQLWCVSDLALSYLMSDWCSVCFLLVDVSVSFPSSSCSALIYMYIEK